MRLLPLFCAILLPFCVQAQFENPLFIPPTLTGTTIDLEVREDSMAFLDGVRTATFGINAAYLGPTLIINKGDDVQLNVTNSLSDTTTMHWHGLHVAPEDDGGPHTKILPGETWSPDFTVLDEASTFWYHPHLHTKTAQQVYNGAAGMLIVRDPNEAALDLPRTYGVDDFPLILQDKTFDGNNQLIFAAMADTMMVNGTLAPYLEIPAQRVRFRLLNASNQRVYNIALPVTANPLMIASDGGLLETPAPISELIMAPGERAEIVLDFSGANGMQVPMGSNSNMLPPGVSGGPGGPGGPPGNSLDNSSFEFLELRIQPPTANPAGPVPATLNTHLIWDEANADVTRVKVMDTLTTGFPFYINGTPFHHDHINDTVYLDDIEVWEIRNETRVAHPFHIHDIQFYILDINGSPPPPHLAGRKDVVLLNVEDTVRFITRFDDHADAHIPYMYHCHNLFHEDAGMMGQFVVLETNTTNTSVQKPITAQRSTYSVAPNPTSSRVRVQRAGGPMPDGTTVSVFNVLGALVTAEGARVSASAFSLDMRSLQSGTYLVVIESPQLAPEVLRVLRQ